MKALPFLVAVAAIGSLLTYTSCTGTGGSGFTSKQDSMNFAKAYFDKYPEENSVKTMYYSADTVVMKGIQPISWATVGKYAVKYDAKPLIYSPAGEALRGYMVDSVGYAMVQANKMIKGLYLRLGRKDDGAVTVMVLGLDGKNNLIKDSANGYNGYANFDNTSSCPKICPLNDTLGL